MSVSYSSPAPVLRVYLVRHGETNENREGIIQGQMDTVLNQDGILQAHLCMETLKNVDFDIAFTSDLKRTTHTAEVILALHPKTQLYKDQHLRERNMGELSGVKVGSYDKTKLPKSVESGREFAHRTLSWWVYAIEQYLPTLPVQSQPCNVLVVSHGAYISTLVNELLYTRRVEPAPNLVKGPCYNTSITTIAMRRDKHGTLEKYADISHLLTPAVASNADEIPPQDGVEDTQQLDK